MSSNPRECMWLEYKSKFLWIKVCAKFMNVNIKPAVIYPHDKTNFSLQNC